MLWALFSMLLIMYPETPFGVTGRAKAGMDGQAPGAKELSAHPGVELRAPRAERTEMTRVGLAIKTPDLQCFDLDVPIPGLSSKNIIPEMLQPC